MSVFSRRGLYRRVAPFTSRLALLRTAARHRLLNGPEPVRILLVSDGKAYTSEQQFAPIVRHAGALRRQLGVVVEPVDLQAAQRLPRAAFASVAVLGLKLSFLTPAAQAERITRHFRSMLEGTPARLIYFDGDDDVCVQWPGVLALVDAYVKKHVFAEATDYGRRYQGKSNLTDYVTRLGTFSFADNVIPASGPVPSSSLSALQLGWNIGLDDKIADLASSMPAPEADAKDIDIACRAFVRPDAWIFPLRAPLIERVLGLADRYRVLAPDSRVSQEQYYEEMRRARICISPFGYGELCWRDFEAVLCGCLVVKPDMGHVRTQPDIFVAGQTYAPVRWDYSDLGDVCARYLNDEPERRRLAANARQVLLDALKSEAFVKRFADLLGGKNRPFAGPAGPAGPVEAGVAATSA